VDRLWPRGIRKADLDLGLWLPEVAPSAQLRRWYGHKPERFEAFTERYRAELADSSAYAQLRHVVTEHAHVTLLTATTDAEHSQAAVLKEVLVASAASAGRHTT